METCNTHVKQLKNTDSSFDFLIEGEVNTKPNVCMALRVSDLEEIKKKCFSLKNNFNELINAYQCIIVELIKSKNENECLETKAQEIRDKCTKIERKMKCSKKKYERLNRELRTIRKISGEKHLLVESLKHQNNYQCSKLEEKSDKLNNYKQLLTNDSKQLAKQKEELFMCLNESKGFQEMLIELYRNELMLSKIINGNQRLKIECALIECKNIELEKLLEKRKTQSQILVKTINHSNTKLQVLNNTLNNINIGHKGNFEPFVDKSLSLTICEITTQNEEMKNTIENNTCKIYEIRNNNDELHKSIDCLLLKIDAITKATNEIQLCFIKEIRRIDVIKANLENMLKLKSKTIDSLDKNIQKLEKINEDDLKMVYDLKKEIAYLKFNQENPICIPYESPKANVIDTNVNKVLNKFCFEQYLLNDYTVVKNVCFSVGGNLKKLRIFNDKKKKKLQIKNELCQGHHR